MHFPTHNAKIVHSKKFDKFWTRIDFCQPYIFISRIELCCIASAHKHWRVGLGHQSSGNKEPEPTGPIKSVQFVQNSLVVHTFCLCDGPITRTHGVASCSHARCTALWTSMCIFKPQRFPGLLSLFCLQTRTEKLTVVLGIAFHLTWGCRWCKSMKCILPPNGSVCTTSQGVEWTFCTLELVCVSVFTLVFEFPKQSQKSKLQPAGLQNNSDWKLLLRGNKIKAE